MRSTLTSNSCFRYLIQRPSSPPSPFAPSLAAIAGLALLLPHVHQQRGRIKAMPRTLNQPVAEPRPLSITAPAAASTAVAAATAAAPRNSSLSAHRQGQLTFLPSLPKAQPQPAWRHRTSCRAEQPGTTTRCANGKSRPPCPPLQALPSLSLSATALHGQTTQLLHRSLAHNAPSASTTVARTPQATSRV